jgi:hypothetical protein
VSKKGVEWISLGGNKSIKSNFEEHWKHEDYRIYVIQQMALYYAGMHTAGKTADILHVTIQDVWKLAKKFDNLYNDHNVCIVSNFGRMEQHHQDEYLPEVSVISKDCLFMNTLHTDFALTKHQVEILIENLKKAHESME